MSRRLFVFVHPFHARHVLETCKACPGIQCHRNQRAHSKTHMGRRSFLDHTNHLVELERRDKSRTYFEECLFAGELLRSAQSCVQSKQETPTRSLPRRRPGKSCLPPWRNIVEAPTIGENITTGSMSDVRFDERKHARSMGASPKGEHLLSEQKSHIGNATNPQGIFSRRWLEVGKKPWFG